MARISTISKRDAQEDVRLVYEYFHAGMAQATGREPKRGAEPLEVYAHTPGLLRGIVALAAASAEQNLVDERLKHLATLKAATITACEYCIDLGSQISRRSGLTDEQLLALHAYATSPLFTDLEKLVLDYAVAVSRTPVDVSDELFDELRRHFSDAQIVELTHAIALENLYGRFNLAMGISAAGFSEGTVCAVPASA